MMMPSSGQDRSHPADTPLAMLAIVVVLGGVLCWMIWVTWHAAISAWTMQAMLWQLHYLPDNPALTQFAHQLQAARSWPDAIRLVQLYNGLSILGCSVRWVAVPVILIAAVIAVVCENRTLRTVLDLEGLIAVQARMFPALQGFAGRRLTTLVNPAEGAPLPADPALTPLEWRQRFAVDSAGRFSEAGALAGFQAQLGVWFDETGALSAPPAARVLFAAFALHRLQRRQDAMALLESLSASLAGAGLDGERGPLEPLAVPQAVLDQAQAILSEGDVQAVVMASGQRHGWTTTALMSLVCDARLAAGVLAPPAFAILKLIDRPLWYALHSLGFPSENPNEDVHPNPRIEATGARAHWEEERRLGRPVYTPAVAPAVILVRDLVPAPAAKGLTR